MGILRERALKDADEMEAKEMPVRKMLVDMIGAFVGAIPASFRDRKIAPFFIRAQSGPRCMTPFRWTGYIDISLVCVRREGEPRATISYPTRVKFLSFSYVSVIPSSFWNLVLLLSLCSPRKNNGDFDDYC